ncbi:MAG: LysR family transcriptional regulator [Pseudomonadota bacterium]
MRDLATLDLRVVLAVAEAGSFRRAAERIGLGQPAVSRRVQRLEEALGVSLFERRPNGARLTFAGEAFASGIRPILGDLSAAIEIAQSAGLAGVGKLRIGAIASLSGGPLRNVMNAFLEKHGEVELTLVELDRSELFTLLSHRRLDAIVAAGEPELKHGDGFLLAREQIYLAVPTDHEWARRERLFWGDVREATFVVSAREPGTEIHDYILRNVSELGRVARIRRHRLGREGVMTLVGLGFGVSLAADHWRGVCYPNVTFVSVGQEDDTVPLSLVWRPENDNPALRRFISLARIEAKRNGALS